MKVALVLLVVVAAVAAGPLHDVVIRKMKTESDLRYQYMDDADGIPHLYDTWVKISDLERMARFDAFTETQFHLFTRANPSVSQPLVINNPGLLASSNFSPNRRTVVLIHGWLGSATALFNQHMVPAYIQAEDVNVIVVDWSAGNFNGNNAGFAALAAANFCNWVNFVTGASTSQYHIVGFSVGGQATGIMAKNMNGRVAYISGLDPSAVWNQHDVLNAADADYVEVIHTSISGWSAPLGHVDFYPNGGTNMPGCILVNPICDHNRSYEYMAESVRTGGFTGTECLNQLGATLQICNRPSRLPMGGRFPKTSGFGTGIFHLRTNRSPPFSRG